MDSVDIKPTLALDTAREDKTRLPWRDKAGYGLGSIAQNLSANGISNLANYVLNIGLGMNPAWVGLLQALPRFVDALADPFIGHVSDRFRSRWGQRRPFMLAGACGAGLLFAGLWILPTGWPHWAHFAYFLAVSLLFYIAASTFGISWMALGYSLTPDYNERTRLMVWNTLAGALAGIVLAWLFALTKLPAFPNEAVGSRVVGACVGVLIIVAGLGSVMLCRERKPENIGQPAGHGFVKNVSQVFDNRPFLLLSGAITCMCVGIFSVASISPYALIYYVQGGDVTRGAVLVGWCGTVWQVIGLLMAPVVGWAGVRLGKRRALLLFLAITLVGNLAKWVCYRPDLPWLSLVPSAFNALGFCALWTLTYSMTADACDFQEYLTGRRADGLIGALQWWLMKLGVSTAFFVSGLLLNLTGFSQALGAAQSSTTILSIRLVDIGLPVGFIALSILFTTKYSLSEERVHEIQAALRERRGRSTGAAAEVTSS